MDADALDRFVREVVDRQPETPRDFAQRPLLVHCTCNLPSAVLIGLGVVTLGVVVRFAVTGELAPGQEHTITGFHATMGSFGLGLVALPLLTYTRIAFVLRRGVRTTARVTDVTSGPGGPAAAQRAPHRVGTWIVDHPLGPYEAPFRRVEGDRRVVDDEVAVLVHPRRPVVLREL